MTEYRPTSDMKDSGIEWIGMIPENWGKNKLRNLVQVINGYPFQSSLYSNEGIFVVRITNVDDGCLNVQNPRYYPEQLIDEYKSCLLKRNDILMTLTGNVGFVGIVEEDYPKSALNQRVGCVRAYNPGIIQKYIYYLFVTQKFSEVATLYSKGTVQLNMSTEWLLSQRVPVPDVQVQKAIADYLDDSCSKIDEIIAEAIASIEEYKELKQAVIFESVTKGLDKKAPMKDSGVEWIGTIPANWTLVRIPRILDYSDIYPLGDGDHGMIKTEDYLNDGIPYIRVQNLGWGTDLLLDNVVYISEDNNNKIKNSQLKPNDVLFCKTGGTIGKTGIVPGILPISNTTSHVGKITVNPVYNPRYVFYVLSSNVGYRQFWEIACQKTTRPELSIAETRQIRLTWPSSRKEQDDIVQYLDAILPEYDALISVKQSLIDDLQAYKKSLIYEVVTGKRRVV